VNTTEAAGRNHGHTAGLSHCNLQSLLADYSSVRKPQSRRANPQQTRKFRIYAVRTTECE
jgi:hypothetical protein